MAKRGTKGQDAAQPKGSDEGVTIEAEAAESAVPEPEILPEPEDEVAQHDEPQPEADAEPSIEDTTPVDPEPTAERQDARPSLVLPMAISILVGAGLGYGLAYFQFGPVEQRLEATIAQQAARIDSLDAGLAALAEAQANLDIDGALAGVEAGAAARVAEVRSELDALRAQVTELERQPNADGTLSPTALAAYEADIAALRDEIAAQEQRMQALVADAAAQLEETREQAEQIEQTAAGAANAAAARAALAQIRAAVESGAPFDSALPDLRAAIGDIPPALTRAAPDGVPTLDDLQAAFPDAARQALSVARAEGVAGEDEGGIGSFLREQFNVRSVEPRDGESADAILSRAEAALRGGRLTDALAEVAALPEVARAELSEWTGMATARADVVSALEALTLSQD
ncbi:hypothetical protein EU803_09355 [Loktanella sp. IMCC34160]|uniref:COG4223 family protein n=1 Tax=Loktanella sp. IMCC34160 TaxID=2510646 RepID=UPI00101CB7EA|nr:hypothetical protein [Loktanella sp. IMCC34160]RYG91292.1 hypothetical protein EU803_09355 [Loktanella sp. IMCC34160]